MSKREMFIFYSVHSYYVPIVDTARLLKHFLMDL
jgi:hypothetical protein